MKSVLFRKYLSGKASPTMAETSSGGLLSSTGIEFLLIVQYPGLDKYCYDSLSKDIYLLFNFVKYFIVSSAGLVG